MPTKINNDNSQKSQLSETNDNPDVSAGAPSVVVLPILILNTLRSFVIAATSLAIESAVTVSVCNAKRRDFEFMNGDINNTATA
ncbi:MAG: hypothetical protein EZS28_029898 [Streblomastix strix]|uniref:Uncharacterized protein n=1 Tax=Streblomastix strix TaxID=222440 RepID=A0A5J4UXV5_9EUKA|nr:MAG: hypothetical protein EZS28_029898 [Streblomastix strix]